MVNRREFITTTSAALSMTAFAGTAYGRRRRSSGSSRNDSKDEIRKAFEEGDFEKAKELAAGRDVEIKGGSIKGSPEPKDDSKRVQDEDWFKHYDSDGSKVNFRIADYDDKTHVTLNWDLKYNNSVDIDGAPPKDAAIVAWEDSQFGLDGTDSVTHNCRYEGRNGDSSHVDTDMQGNGVIGGSGASAIGIKVFDAETGNDLSVDGIDRMYGALTLTLNKQNYPNRSEGQIGGLYKHTWSVFGHAGYNFLENVTITKDPLAVELDTFSDSWRYYGDETV